MDPREKQLNALRESLRYSPENVPLRRMVAESLLDLERFDDAEKEAKAGLQYDGDDAGCKTILAQVCLHKGNYSMGLVLAEDILAKSDDDDTVWLLHARLLQRAGQAEEAQASLRRAIALNPALRESELGEQLESADEPPASPAPGMRAGSARGNAGQQLVEDAFASYPLELPPHSDRLPVAGRDPELPGFVMEKPPFGFDAVGGMASVKDDVRMKIILPSTNQELYAMYGKKAGGGILLYGPPGCGKTHIARATAGEIEAKFINIGLHDILDMWVGNSEKQLHEVFEYARKNAPCVLFFDEVDALAASRTDMRNSASRHTINQFLAELDGVDASNEGILVLAATNAPWHLDSAFRRPGRFDEVIFVPPPDADARAKILKIFLADKPTESVDYNKIAAKAKEFSGADLRGLVDRVIEEKLRQAMKTGKPEPIRTKDILASLKRQRASTQEWLSTARNYAAFANEGGVYDDIKAYLNLK